MISKLLGHLESNFLLWLHDVNQKRGHLECGPRYGVHDTNRKIELYRIISLNVRRTLLRELLLCKFSGVTLGRFRSIADAPIVEMWMTSELVGEIIKLDTSLGPEIFWPRTDQVLNQNARSIAKRRLSVLDGIVHLLHFDLLSSACLCCGTASQFSWRSIYNDVHDI